jgi:small GTP-binding protein
MNVKVVAIPDSNVSVELYLIDTSGNDAFLEYIYKYGTFTSCVLVYDVSNIESFNSISKWIAQIKKLKTTKGGIMGVLIANKVDLGNRRVVSTFQGEELAKASGLGYFEVSAVRSKKNFNA